MKLLYSIILLYLLARSVSTSISGSDVLSSVNTIVQGLAKETVNVIPTPLELLTFSKEALLGVPQVALFEILSQLCKLYIASDTIEPRITPDINEMSLILHSNGKTTSYQLTQAEKILEDEDFDVDNKLAILFTGWLSDPQEDYAVEMADAFLCRGGYNFMVLNASQYIQTLYTWSSFNADEIGRMLSLGIQKLPVSADNIHLMGFSLGAQVGGYAGRYYYNDTGSKIARITGLDPANPCFNNGHTLSNLQAGDAVLVDIIHTNNDALGKKEAAGDLDFYPEGYASLKPGCLEFDCSHHRAVFYFIETIYPGNGNNFMSKRCTSLTALINEFCEGPEYPMGFEVPHTLKDIFFLSVKSTSPYGKNSSDQEVASSDRQKCLSQ